ncbi:TetR/AcrR family transcriptional regulator [Massilia luteola]|jgi:AcrR family transcriptional regulator|uniref:TetR/AcrR family transcriptional regulator n=1 Tax=Massilia luteola TaxID=3081751 RepID=UPI002ACBFCA4|nr:TetR/AcrR family transcriptional regulator [Massilia sp. Gc5]
MTTKERILAIAISELEAHGLDGLSLRAVGQKAGITPMAVYRHFADKAALLQAVGAHALDRWQRRVQALGDLPLPAGFEAIATAFVDFALDEPALFDAAFVLKTRAERIYPDDFEAGRSPVIGGFAQRLAEGQAAGLVRAGPPLELAMATWGVLQGLVALHRSGRFNLSRPAFTALCLRSAARIYLKGDGQ